MRRKRFQKHTDEWEDKFTQGITEKRIEMIRAAFEHLFKLTEKKEGYLYIVEKDEVLILNEEEKTEKKELVFAKELQNLLNNLGGKDPSQEFQQGIAGPLNDVLKAVLAGTDQIRRVLAYLIDDNVGGVSRQNFITQFREETGVERSIKGEARREKRDIKQEKYGLAQLYSDLNKLSTGKIKNVETVLRRMCAVEKKEFFAMKEEVNFIYDIVTKATFLYVELLVFTREQLPQQIKQLEEQRFLDADLANFKKEYEKMDKAIYEHIKQIYSLGRYEETHAIR
jgi:putative sterol carrier protein